MSTSILQDFTYINLCLIPSHENQRILKEVWVDVRIPIGTSAKDSIGKNPMGFNPMNQTSTIGKIPKDLNPTRFLCKSFESNMPLLSFQ